MTIAEIINQIPDWKNNKTITYQPLTTGYSNMVYKVSVNNKHYALRINGTQNKFLGLHYKDEIEIMTLASQYGLTPKVLPCENKTDYLITEFVEGTLLGDKDLSRPDILPKVVQLLKTIHRLPYKGSRESTPFTLARRYLKGAEDLGLSYPAELHPFIAKMNQIEANRINDPDFMTSYCHNDAFAHNMILSPDGNLKILDWELSGRGDIWFDLATLSFSGGFNHATEQVMLELYFGSSDDEKMKTLADIKFVCMIREIGWALMHTALNRNKPVPGTDYSDFANAVLNRLQNGYLSLI